TRPSGAASAAFRSTSGTVRNAARSTRSAENAIGRATASGDGRSGGREAWSNPSHQIPPAIAVMESARSAMLFRSTVATSVAIASMAALIPTLRFGPRRQPTIGARNDVANTAVAMTARVVLDCPKKVCWKVDENVRTSATRKRRPMTAKVTSPSIRRATIGLGLGAPGLGESRGGFIDQVADFHDGAEPRVVRHRPHDERAYDVAGDADRDDGRTAALDETLEGRCAIGVAKRVHELLERRRGDDAAFAAGARDRVVAIGELDREAACRDPERVVELARGERARDELA